MQPVEPRNHTPRSDRPTLGSALATIAQAKGRPLMPWQQRAADVALEVDPATGLPWYGIVVVTVPRQSGKTKLIGDVADHRALTVPDARIWYTAQTGKDASAWMRDEHFPSLERARVFGRPGTASARYTRSKRAGQEGIDWRHGSTFRVFPPLRDALHGRQSDLVFVDEAWALSAEQGADVRQAIRPTMATRAGAQLWIVSTMGDDSSSFFDGYVDLGLGSLNNPNSRVCLIDYGLRDDDDPEDLDLVASRHPAYRHTIHRETFTDARHDFGHDIAGWVRAYGNRPTRTRVTAFPDGVWSTAARPRQPVPERAGIGFDVSPDGRNYAIAAGWFVGEEGFVELLASGPVHRDLPAQIAEIARRRRAPLTIDRQAAAALEVVDGFARLPEADRPEVTFLSLAQYASACVTFSRGIYNDTVHHANDEELDAAAAAASKRDLPEGGFGWTRRGGGNIAPLVAATVALKAADLIPKPASRPRILLSNRTA